VRFFVAGYGGFLEIENPRNHRRKVSWEAGTLPTKGGAQSLLKIFLENDEALLKQALEKQSSKAQDPN